MSNTTNKNLQRPANGSFNNTWDVPLNSDFTYIDSALGASVSYNATAGSQTLTNGVSDSYSYIPLIIKITGAMSANVTYTIPSGVGGQWIIYNSTTDATGGPWTVTFASAGGGTSVVVPRSNYYLVACDGTNVSFVPSYSSGVPVGGGSDKVFYPNDQTVTTSFSLSGTQNYGTFGPVTTATGAVVTVPEGTTWSIV